MAFGTLNALKKGDITPRQVRRGAGLIGPLKLNSTLQKGDGSAMPKKKTDDQPDPIDALRMERGRELARLRQNRPDPGSPCGNCGNAACPPFCKPKHKFERQRRNA